MEVLSFRRKVTYRRVTRIYRTSSPSWSWACDIFIGMGLIMTWKSAITWRRSRSRCPCAKKVRETQRTKNCILSSSNLIGIINVLKIGSRISFLSRDLSGFVGRWIFKKENWYYRKGGLVIGDTWEYCLEHLSKILELVGQVTWSKIHRYAK